MVTRKTYSPQHKDVNSYGVPQVEKNSLNAAGGLAILLHWMSLNMAGFSLKNIFSITPAVWARDLQHAFKGGIIQIGWAKMKALKGLRIHPIPSV
ncbi:uncharacterized protein VP01_2200g1 [Puccinia sorghi]|uniref:Uncharacterized protein n=1 Tax=Puccinia sorghi TaxID=27349 RepID=A0A0L6V908_9BASI|nr:uncharacterized protein VP01_2200g1 [Puccinia sorghi]